MPTSIYAEEITDFRSNIVINTNGTIDVVENIVYDFEDVYRHGIFRSIPITKTNTEGKKFRLDFSNFSVTDDKGKAYRFSRTSEGDTIKLKIGDADKTITGRHTYIISYNASGALTYFSDHDELYWNAVGTDWTVPITHTTATVSLPVMNLSDVTQSCFVGSLQSTSQNCSASFGKTSVIFSSLSSLSPNEGLTIVVGFPKNIVAVLEPKDVINFSDILLGKIVIALILLVVGLLSIAWYIYYPIYLIIKWYNVGRDPQATVGVTSASFDPPKTPSGRPLTPGETGALLDETVDMQDISATIIDLARRGYIKIIEKKKNEFSLQKLKDSKDKALLPFEKMLIEGFFGDEEFLDLKDAELIDEIQDVKDSLYIQLVTDGLFPENPESMRKFYLGITSAALFTLNIPLVLISLIFGRNIPRKTLFGTDQANVARSLKNFLTSQERQLTFQAKNQLFFEKLLPYAVAFGVEKVWAERFKDIALRQPEWYQGYSGYNYTSTNFINSLNSSFDRVNQAATPVSTTSSSSGFSSGFSGGSSGGGGGGGGSW